MTPADHTPDVRWLDKPPPPIDIPALEAMYAEIWANAGDAPYKRDARDGYEGERADEYMGTCADDDRLADMAAERDWASRWPA